VSVLLDILSNRWGDLTLQVSPGSLGVRTTGPEGTEVWFYFDLTDPGEVDALQWLIQALQEAVRASRPQ
jgi:hypothetical protein